VPIACIVEGHGDVSAVPELIRRIGAELTPPAIPSVERPIRVPGSRLRKPDELSRAVELAAARAGAGGGILILFDAEDDCPAELGPEILEQVARDDVHVTVVLAKYEYEAWFLAAAESIRGRRGLADDLHAPNEPEAVRGAKEWLRERMEGSRTYAETLDQVALTAVMDLESARRADSFDKCYREVERLLTAAT
jgi:hypothetical protein